MSDAERAEAAFWAGFLRNRNVDAGTAGDGAIPVAGGYALCVTGTLLDYAIGAGSTRPLRADDCDVVEEFYALRGLPSRFELHLETYQRDGELLRSRGYDEESVELSEFEGTTARLKPSNGVAVRTTRDRRAWTELLAVAIADQGIEPNLMRRTAALNAAAAHILVVASIDGTDVGVGAAGISGDAAIFFSSAVLPAYRRRGAQRAMFEARLGLAYARGAARVFVKGTPGGPTERCALRCGFTRGGLRQRVRLLRRQYDTTLR